MDRGRTDAADGPIEAIESEENELGGVCHGPPHADTLHRYEAAP
jgi:hypothetical protein